MISLDLIKRWYQQDGVLYKAEIIDEKIRLMVYKHVETFFLDKNGLKEYLKQNS